MNRAMIRAPVGWALAALVFTCGAGAEPPRALAREDLIGAWRLVAIEASGPEGVRADAFYGAGTRGLIIYDASGWFSVQIENAARPELKTPEARPADDDRATQLAKAAALDSYYAYYGTWTFDVANSTVAHFAEGSMYPDEHGVTYTQEVRIEGNRMTFSRRQGPPGRETVQTKIWQRVAD